MSGYRAYTHGRGCSPREVSEMLGRSHRVLVVPLVVMTALASACSSKTSSSPAAAALPTYAKDVAPILQKNCETCHRPGEAGPFSLLTYADARPRAREIKSSILA